MSHQIEQLESQIEGFREGMKVLVAECNKLRMELDHEKERSSDLDACLRSNVKELLKVMDEDTSDKAVEEWITVWFDSAHEYEHQYDHIGR